MNLKDVWAEFEHILGIAQAVAPMVAIADPNAAAGIGSAEAMIQMATPLVNSVVNQSANSATPVDTATATSNAIKVGLAIAQATGKVSSEKAAQINALTPVLVATVVAAQRPVTPTP